MALTKNEIIQKVVDELEFTREDATETVEQLMEIIKSTLASGEDVLIPGFGRFFFLISLYGRVTYANFSNNALRIFSQTIETEPCYIQLRQATNRQ